MIKLREAIETETTPSLEPAPPLEIEVSEEEILADLIYPAEAKGMD
jgi:hypothetical protein